MKQLEMPNFNGMNIKALMFPLEVKRMNKCRLKIYKLETFTIIKKLQDLSDTHQNETIVYYIKFYYLL